MGPSGSPTRLHTLYNSIVMRASVAALCAPYNAGGEGGVEKKRVRKVVFSGYIYIYVTFLYDPSHRTIG